jgi:tetratricopeptide (TPR) repeat protein
MTIQYRRGASVRTPQAGASRSSTSVRSLAATRPLVTDPKYRMPAEPPHSACPQKGKRHGMLMRSAIAVAVVAVAAGCATLDADVAKAWTIGPVLNVAHSLQSSQAYYTMGRYHDGSQAWDKSVEAYRKAIAADARNIEAYNALGVALARSGRYADAETTLRQAIALDPVLAHVRSNLGYVLLLAGKPADAVSELRAAIQQDGSNTKAQANLNDALARLTTVQAGQGAQGEARAVAAASGADPEPSPLPLAVMAAEPPGLIVEVPRPITSITVPAPQPALISVAVPLQTASVPAAIGSATPASLAAKNEPSRVVRVVDQPTMGALDEPVAEGVNRPFVRQSIVRAVVPAQDEPAVEVLAMRLEVSNGNGVLGMAARVSQWLASQGVVKTARLTNQKPFEQETTIVQYRSGQEEAALRVARSLPAPAKAEPAPTDGLRGDVRVVLGRDWVKVGACVDSKTCRPESAAVAVAKADK